MSKGESLRKSGPIGEGGSAAGSDEKLLSHTARETPAHNSGENTQTKFIHSGGVPTNDLGGKGHGGSV
jgi:hypothetical protein